jgi:hypothetical protein
MAAISVRHSLPYQAAAQALSSVDPAVVLRLLVGLSGTVNAGVSRSHSMARALIVCGSQRLRGLRINAPRLRLPAVDLSRVLAAAPNLHRSAEETAFVLAVLELYIGLLLQMLAEQASRLPVNAHRVLLWLPRLAPCPPRWPPHLFPKARSNPPGLAAAI